MNRDIQIQRFIASHPVQANFIAVGIAVLLLELAIGLRLVVDWLAR